LKISWIKYEKDNMNFRTAEKLGMNVYKIHNLDETDKKLQELVNENYNTIIISSEVAGFSEDIIKKYKTEKNVNIIISPRI
jgi:sugar-specific transcriptional regulator TrmB